MGTPSDSRTSSRWRRTSAFRSHLDQLGLDEDAYAQAYADMNTLETQLRAPRPHLSVVRALALALHATVKEGTDDGAQRAIRAHPRPGDPGTPSRPHVLGSTRQRLRPHEPCAMLRPVTTTAAPQDSTADRPPTKRRGQRQRAVPSGPLEEQREPKPRTGSRSDFPPIADYAFLSDCETTA